MIKNIYRVTIDICPTKAMPVGLTWISLTNCFDFEECSMNDHTIFIGRKTCVDASVLIFGVVDIKAVFSHLTPSLRERCWGRSCPFNLRCGISKKVTGQPCLFT